MARDPYKCKMIVVGQCEAGKSQMLSRAFDFKYEFDDNYNPTITAAFLNITVQQDNKTIKLKTFEVTGSESFICLVPVYSGGSHIALLCYDIANSMSLSALPMYIEAVQEKAPNVEFILVGTKCDLEQNRQVSVEERCLFADNRPAIIHSTEISAKTGAGMSELLEFAAKRACENMLYQTKNKFDRFLTAYNRDYDGSFFKNRIKGKRWGDNSNLEDIAGYAKKNSKSRTAKIYYALDRVDNDLDFGGCGCRPI